MKKTENRTLEHRLSGIFGLNVDSILEPNPIKKVYIHVRDYLSDISIIYAKLTPDSRYEGLRKQLEESDRKYK